MNPQDLLHFARGPGMQLAVGIFVLGLLYRFLHLYLLGHKKSLAVPRGSAWGPGLRTIWTRSFFHPGMTTRGYFTLIAGYTFHLGFLISLFLLAQHIDFFRAVIGFGWPALPTVVIDATAILSIAALIAVLVHRLTDPVRRLLSDFQDYFTWLLTILPLLTGFLLLRRVGTDYATMLAMHILSFELLIAAIPFTKLMHMITIFPARWYNGAFSGVKGVQS